MHASLSLPTTQPSDMSRLNAVMECCFTHPADLPISFVLDGQTIHGIPASWNPTCATYRIDANITVKVFEGTDIQTGLSVMVECFVYLDYPVVEWVAWFRNPGDKPTPLVSDIRALDTTFAGAEAAIYHCNGDFYSADGYTPQETPLPASASLSFAPNGGRSCDGAFPYYRVAFADGGLTLAVGWPAQWAISFEGEAEGVHVRAGQEKTALRLLPGECIRTPRMTLLSWSGDTTRAVNLWRRWYLAHVLPRPDGRPLQPHLACCAPDEGEEFTAATEENQVRYMDKFKQLGINYDVWWIDAGWYPCYGKDGVRHWPITGTWQPDPERFPNGLKPVSERAARDGADLLIWFEPERVQPGTAIALEHPEFLLRARGSDNALLFLGNPAARQWLTDHVCKLIQDNGIRIYRQDHNFAPLVHWRQNEAEDRQGMNENLHVQGYLQYWDDLLARNPGLWIDSCASGGRRNDLETMRRSVPLHYTDYGYGEHPVKLAFHHTLYEWIPYFKEFTLSYDIGGQARFDNCIDSFSYHCAMAPMLFVTFDIRRDDYDYPLAVKLMDMWRRAAGTILNGDYYPHTPFHKSAQQWVAWQFDNPEAGCGLIQAIRLQEAPQEAFILYPKALRLEASYTFVNAETGETQEAVGAEVMRDGFLFKLEPRNGQIWFYKAE
ncbi:MAG: alpha-galactosidase [Anaerolineae bacterium]